MSTIALTNDNFEETVTGPGITLVDWDGILVFSQPGALPAATVEQLIQAVRDLDMDEVRSKLSERHAPEASR